MKRRKERGISEIWSLVLRYFVLFIVAIPDLWIFYFIFTPLTVLAVYFLLRLFFDVVLVGNVLLISLNFPVEIIDACVAGAAYYLLLILNLSTPKIGARKRIQITLFSFSSFFILNVLRIFFLSILFVKGASWFDFAHLVFWYMGSIFFVVAIWFVSVRIFKIKEIPFYSDLKNLFEKTKTKKKLRKRHR